MSIHGLQFMVARAVISDQYRVGILNGHKADLIQELDLDPGESAQVMAIRANTLAEFAAEVDRIVQAQPLPRPRTVNAQGLQRHM